MKAKFLLSTTKTLFLLLLVSLFSSCTCTQRLNMGPTVPPSFQLKGNAIFDWCEIFDITVYRTDNTMPPPIWRLEPNGMVIKLDDLAQITYGQIPVNLVQVIPKAGQPPALLEGHRYHFRAIVRTPDTIALKQVFMISGGKIEILEEKNQYSSSCFAD